VPILPAVPVPAFQLTPRPFEAVGIDRTAYLPVIEGLCRFLATLQDDRGAIIDPIVKVECQYSTPYFAFGVGVLVGAGHAPELLAGGIRAMDHATCCFAGGSDTIPQRHGEFFLAYLPAALEPYRPLIAAELWETWRERLKLPLDQVIQGPDNNWRTYAMRGEWLRASLGLADPAAATAFVTRGWRDPGNGETAQRDRIVPDLWNLYQDGQTDPQSHAVEAVGRLNLLGLVEAGFDGPDAAEILACAERGTLTSLLLQSPDGQCPPNGRTDDHVFNDVLYQAAFEIMAERALKLGELELAARYRRAALLSFKSLARWRRTDGEWAGSFTVTKNRFPPEERVGYQPASQVTNYNGALVAHLADCYLEQGSEIPELPAPCEVGGYAFATDEKFASAVANAGGMQLFAALRGDTEPKFDHCWTPLGVNRFSRAGWDGRLGPGDGVRDAKTGRGVSFGPTWFEDGHWVRIADVPHRYRGHFSVEFVHPLLVRCAINYRPLDGTGPTFHHGFVVTPDGVLANLV